MATPSHTLCLPYSCKITDVSAHVEWGGSHPTLAVTSGDPIDPSTIGTDYEIYLDNSMTSCAIGA